MDRFLPNSLLRYVHLVQHVRNWPAYFVFKIGLKRPQFLDFTLRAGLRIEVPTRVLHEFKEVFFDECYTRGMPKAVPPHSDILDIGANVGSFSLYAVARFPGNRVLAFEPDPVNYAQLAKNASFNPDRNLVIVNEAVGDKSGEARFSNDQQVGFTTGGRIVEADAPHAFTVKMVGIDDLFGRYGIRRCGLLKLDCEGAEFPILHAASLSVLDRIDQMVIEVHAPKLGGEMSMAGLAAHLEKQGFRTGRHRELLWAWHA